MTDSDEPDFVYSKCELNDTINHCFQLTPFQQVFFLKHILLSCFHNANNCYTVHCSCWTQLASSVCSACFSRFLKLIDSSSNSSASSAFFLLFTAVLKTV